MFPLESLSKLKFFTFVLFVSFVQHSCQARVVRVALVLLVSHSCRSRVGRVALVSHLCHSYGTHIACVWQLCCKIT